MFGPFEATRPAVVVAQRSIGRVVAARLRLERLVGSEFLLLWKRTTRLVSAIVRDCVAGKKCRMVQQTSQRDCACLQRPRAQDLVVYRKGSRYNGKLADFFEQGWATFRNSSRRSDNISQMFTWLPSLHQNVGRHVSQRYAEQERSYPKLAGQRPRLLVWSKATQCH